MPRLLSEENKRNGVVDSEAILAKDKGTLKAVGFLTRTGSEKGKDGEIGRQSDGHGFFVMHTKSSTPITWRNDKR